MAFSGLAMALWVAVLVVALVRWSETRRVLPRGLALAGLIALLGLPWTIVALWHFDPTFLTPGLPPEVRRIARGVGVVASLLMVPVAVFHQALELAVAVMAGDRSPFPLLLRAGSRFAGWLAAGVFGAGAALASHVVFRWLAVGTGAAYEALTRLTPGLDITSPVVVLGALLPQLVGAALAEELLFRGILQAGLARLLGGGRGAVVVATVVASATWSVGHALNTDQVGVKMAQIFVVGLGFGTLARRYSVEAAMVSHVLLNVVAVMLSLLWP